MQLAKMWKNSTTLIRLLSLRTSSFFQGKGNVIDTFVEKTYVIRCASEATTDDV